MPKSRCYETIGFPQFGLWAACATLSMYLRNWLDRNEFPWEFREEMHMIWLHRLLGRTVFPYGCATSDVTKKCCDKKGRSVALAGPFPVEYDCRSCGEHYTISVEGHDLYRWTIKHTYGPSSYFMVGRCPECGAESSCYSEWSCCEDGVWVCMKCGRRSATYR
jgi:hypothetical protein